jgi:hypothetical protein
VSVRTYMKFPMSQHGRSVRRDGESTKDEHESRDVRSVRCEYAGRMHVTVRYVPLAWA